MGALAEDHLNDVVSNAGAIITATIASRVKGAWFVDPLGAIVISLWIISRWIGLTYVQVRISFLRYKCSVCTAQCVGHDLSAYGSDGKNLLPCSSRPFWLDTSYIFS